MRDLNNNLNQTEATHKSHAIQQFNEKCNDEEGKARHDQEVLLMSGLKKRKE